MRGALFENMVVADLIKNKYNSGATHPDLYFYRDKSQKEVDVVEELAYPNLAIYEIKSAQSLKSDFFRNMAYFRKLFGDDVKSSTLIYDGDDELHTPEDGYLNFRHLHSFGQEV